MSQIVKVSDYALDLLLGNIENDTDTAINRACNELGIDLSGDCRKQVYDFIESELTGNMITDAAEASEYFGDDTLERFASEMDSRYDIEHPNE
jgi:hypothetical protein